MLYVVCMSELDSPYRCWGADSLLGLSFGGGVPRPPGRTGSLLIPTFSSGPECSGWLQSSEALVKKRR